MATVVEKPIDTRSAVFAYDVNTEGPRPANTDGWEYVTIPEKDIFDQTHEGVGINTLRFTAGRTYLCHPSIAAEVRRLLIRAEAQNIKLMQPKKDVSALLDLAKTGRLSPASQMFGPETN